MLPNMVHHPNAMQSKMQDFPYPVLADETGAVRANAAISIVHQSFRFQTRQKLHHLISNDFIGGEKYRTRSGSPCRTYCTKAIN